MGFGSDLNIDAASITNNFDFKNLIFKNSFKLSCLFFTERFFRWLHTIFSRLRTVQKIRRKRLVLVINNGHNRKSTKFNCHFIKPVPVLQMRLDRINLPDPDPPFICTGNWSVIKKFKKVIHIDVPEQYWGFVVLSFLNTAFVFSLIFMVFRVIGGKINFILCKLLSRSRSEIRIDILEPDSNYFKSFLVGIIPFR